MRSCETYCLPAVEMTEPSGYKISLLFLQWMCEKNVDGTKNLLLHGRQLFRRIGHRIQDYDVNIICQFLTQYEEVIAVDLCYNNIGDDGMAILVKFLETNKSVKYLDLMLNNIGTEGVKKLVELGENLNLSHLRLNGNKIGTEGGILLSELLEINKNLVHLDLAETDQTIKSLAYICPALKENTTLKHIDISRVIGPPYYFFDAEHCAQLLEMTIRVNNTITELHLQKLMFDCYAVEFLVEGFKENKSIKMLDLSCNSIGDNGAIALEKFLQTNPPLQALMLNHNKIRDIGAKSIGYGCAFSKLRLLDLAHNLLTDEGIIYILYAVRKEHNLLVLFFWGNKITLKTISVLENMLIEKILQQSSLDIKVYRDEFNQLQMAYNSPADLYKQRYYSVVPKEKRKKDEPPLGPNDLSFQNHNVVRSWEIHPST